MVERREDPAGSTAMFRAFVQRGEAEKENENARRVSPLVWALLAIVVLAVVAVVVFVVAK